MPEKIKIGAIAVVIAGVVLAFVFFRSGGEEVKINRRLDSLVDIVEKSKKESRLAALAVGPRVAGYFTEDCEVQGASGMPSASGKDLIGATLANMRMRADKVSVSVWQRTVTLGSDEMTANMNLRVVVSGSQNDEDYRDDARFYIDWVKDDGDWLIARVSTPEEE